ncbi:MAG: copper chaperone PCu(A)C, partial [Alphaproteobacteria bacterium]|nr:copper chaperone PCu(A)C [Alphaproteobacteria bacterium]
MRPLSEGLFIPAGETVMLKPGGYHVMFMGLNQPLSQEGEFEVVLNFKHAGSIRVMFDAKRNQGQTH